MSERTIPVRLSLKTQIALNMIAGDMQADTGSNVSIDEAAWKLINEARPKVAMRAAKRATENKVVEDAIHDAVEDAVEKYNNGEESE